MVNESRRESRRGKQPRRPGSERHADEQRKAGGPRYHGEAWQRAEEEPERGPDVPATEETALAALEVNDEEVKEPGARGAVFGRGGTGLVARDATREAPSNRDRKRDRGK